MCSDWLNCPHLSKCPIGILAHRNCFGGDEGHPNRYLTIWRVMPTRLAPGPVRKWSFSSRPKWPKIYIGHWGVAITPITTVDGSEIRLTNQHAWNLENNGIIYHINWWSPDFWTINSSYRAQFVGMIETRPGRHACLTKITLHLLMSSARLILQRCRISVVTVRSAEIYRFGVVEKP